jgi:hypothetical protein
VEIARRSKNRRQDASQFYRDLKRLASTLISDDVVLVLWRSRLPLSIRLALDDQLKDQEDQNENVLTEKADLIYQTEQLSAVSAEETMAASKQTNRASDTLHDQVSRLEAQTSALPLDSRPSSRSERQQPYATTIEFLLTARVSAISPATETRTRKTRHIRP